MKPILFNSEMTAAILKGRKNTTRRIVKPQPPERLMPMRDGSCWPGYFGNSLEQRVYRPPVFPGDILYVRETWNFIPCIDCNADLQNTCMEQPSHYEDRDMEAEGCWVYRADYPRSDRLNWRPSIHMPKDAARIFLMVDDVSCERLQEITPEECIREGVEPEAMEVGGAFTRGMFQDIWDSTVKRADQDTCGWTGNPWVWRIKFHRIGKETAICMFRRNLLKK